MTSTVSLYYSLCFSTVSLYLVLFSICYRFTSADITTYLHAARCAHAWFQFGGITIANCDNIIQYLLEICANCYWKCSSPNDGLSSDETELIEATLEAVCTIVAHPLSHKYPMLVTIQLDRIMNKLLKILQAERGKNDFDMVREVFYFREFELRVISIVNFYTGCSFFLESFQAVEKNSLKNVIQTKKLKLVSVQILKSADSSNPHCMTFNNSFNTFLKKLHLLNARK